jgi:Fe-S-cluster containining protein
MRRARYLRYSREMGALRPAGDRKLIQIIDAALADAGHRSGGWLACKPGCTQCCVGVFAINQLDEARLREGLGVLRKSDGARAKRIVARSRESVARLSAEFPGNPDTGVLDVGEDAERRFADFANDEVCPVLDPETGLCDLYEWRPMTCRTFGPAVQSEDGIAVCELCFQGASDAEIAACEMVVDPDDMESKLLTAVEKRTGVLGETIVAWCLAQEGR